MSVWQARWRGWSARFAALQPREKMLIAAAAAVAVFFGGYSLWIEPALLQAKQLKATLAQQREEQSRLEEQVTALKASASDPNAAIRASIERLKAELALTEREIEGYGNTLIPPERIPALLQRVLARHRGLTLVSLATLPPRPLVEKQAKAETSANDAPVAADAAKPESAVQASANLYQHGIEIKLAGGYHDLLAYVAELDASPQKLLRGKLDLVVKAYPVSELTLTVYTLSLDPRWLVV
ncbi:type II secretion system protein GspM [Sulfuricystis multivorans]|uniref:type II secretion system protein GspM n=1 Tax=Sulfuricystis multivorans TaxID=2211108 RepID=UPI000F829213|nr:type II secretion system protein GspM [Sulfuricystis multivorans]